MDYPKLTTYLSRTMFSLIQKGTLNVADLIWIDQPTADKADDDEELYFVE
jgi:hypothetical protein